MPIGYVAKNVKDNPEKEEIVRVVLYMAEGFAYANSDIIQRNPSEAMKEFDRLLDYVKKLYDN